MGSDATVARERMWRGHLAAWTSSGLSQAAYCRRHALTQHDFSWWKRELARRDARTASAAAAAFVPVRVTALPLPSYTFELELRGGRVLRFDARVDVAALRSVLAALEPERGSC